MSKKKSLREPASLPNGGEKGCGGDWVNEEKKKTSQNSIDLRDRRGQ